jgi:hypothetical protein
MDTGNIRVQILKTHQRKKESLKSSIILNN